MEPERTILLGVTGSIAAYKAADLASQLTKQGYAVHCVMTADACRFITPLTLQTLSRYPVTTDLFAEEEGTWRPTHLSLADTADLMLVAPATANVIAKLALGLADDALSTMALALRPEVPLVIAPAMNGKMWSHPATKTNVETLQARGATFIGPAAGMLACGYEGIGRLWDVTEIVAQVMKTV